MPLQVTVDLAPLEKMVSGLDKVQEALTTRVLEDDKDNVPVRTGALQGSGHVSGKDEFTYDEHYAGYVYFGTRYMDPRKWFIETMSQHEGDWEQFVSDRILGE